jgi:hypothetical protein
LFFPRALSVVQKGLSMAKKKRAASVGERFRQAVSNMANAASVAATGSEIGLLELAAEDELGSNTVKPSRKARGAPRKKVRSKAPRKKVRTKKASKLTKRKRTGPRR